MSDDHIELDLSAARKLADASHCPLCDAETPPDARETHLLTHGRDELADLTRHMMATLENLITVASARIA